jgi:GGDEF domain-containing protein
MRLSAQRSRDLAETVGELQESVVWDDLAGLVSWSRFEQLITQRIGESQSSGCAFRVLFIDLDHLKSMDYTLVHEALLSPAVGCVTDGGGHGSTGS